METWLRKSLRNRGVGWLQEELEPQSWGIFVVAAQEFLLSCPPGEFGLRRTPFFFMKPSFWSKHRKNYKELYESSVNGSLSFSEIVEPVPSEFQGKEAIRYSPCPACGRADHLEF